MITGLNGTIVINGEPAQFNNLDFCCTQHFLSFVDAQPVVATPSPPYGPPPTLP